MQNNTSPGTGQCAVTVHFDGGGQALDHSGEENSPGIGRYAVTVPIGARAAGHSSEKYSLGMGQSAAPGPPDPSSEENSLDVEDGGARGGCGNRGIPPLHGIADLAKNAQKFVYKVRHDTPWAKCHKMQIAL